MNKEEIGKILAIAAAFDQRTTGVVDIDAWHEVIGSLSFDAARYQVIHWYSRHRERIMPVDVLNPEVVMDDEFWER